MITNLILSLFGFGIIIFCYKAVKLVQEEDTPIELFYKWIDFINLNIQKSRNDYDCHQALKLIVQLQGKFRNEIPTNYFEKEVHTLNDTLEKKRLSFNGHELSNVRFEDVAGLM